MGLPRLSPAIALAALTGCAAAPGTIHIASGGNRRAYILAAPSAPAAPRPLLIALHGWLGTPTQMASMTGFSTAAARLGVDVVYPKGEWRAWGIDETSPRGAADAAFLQAVATDAASRTAIDRNRIFAVGFSNGGFMAQALACSGRLHLDGIAIVASGLAARAAKTCKPDGPIPFLLIQGTADPIVPSAGLPDGPANILPSWQTLQFWAGVNGCNGFTEAPAPTAEPGTEVTHATGLDCKGAPTEAWFIQGAGHGWPGGDFGYPAFIVGRQTHAIDATQTVLRFLLARPQPAREPSA
jgi:polyhydroxybutyrate depolymerase